MTLEADEPLFEAEDKPSQDKKKAKKLKVWDKITYSRPEQANPGDFYYSSSKSLQEINCTTRALKPLQKIYYGADGDEIKSILYSANERTKSVIPDTAEEWVFDFACNFKPPKAVTPASRKPHPKPSPSQDDKTRAASKPAVKQAVKKEAPKKQPAKAPTSTKSDPSKPPAARQTAVSH